MAEFLTDREKELLAKINELMTDFKQAQTKDNLPSFVGCQVDFHRLKQGISGDVYSWNPSAEFGFSLYEPNEEVEFKRLQAIYGPDELDEFKRLHSIYGANL